MKKKFLKITIICMLLIITYTTIVKALSLTVSMETNTTTIQEATEFTVQVKVSNLDVGDNGINSLTGTLKFNKDIFEEITESSIEGINGWSTSYEKDTGKITATKQSFVKTEESVFNITLKTKSNITGKEGIVEFTDIKALNSDSQIDAPNISVTILIGTVSGNAANATSNNTTNAIQTINSSTNNSAKNKANNTTNNTTNTNNATGSYINSANVLNENMPNTGVKDTLAIAIFVVIAIAIIVFIRIERINKEMNDK